MILDKTSIYSQGIRHIVLSLVLFFVSSQYLFSRVLRVEKNKGETISTAIARAESGDTLIIPSGNYAEPTIVVDKSLYIKGENFPVLDGQDKNEILETKANYVTITGLKFINAGRSDINDMAAIKIFNGHHVEIRSNIIEHAYFSIYLQGCTNCFIYNNFIHGVKASEMMSGNGIHCWHSDSLRIFQNNISSQRDGIYFEFVTNSLILGNFSHNNERYGLHFMFSNSDTYTSNIFQENGAGVAVMYTKNLTMLYNKFLLNWGDAAYGLLLKDISDSKIEGNTFQENTEAVHIEGSTRMEFRNNLFLSNGWAAQVQASCMDIVVTHNCFVGNSFDISTNGDLVLTKFDGNYWDKYEGYDLDRNGIGDVPYRPVGLYSVIIQKIPSALMLFRSPMTNLLDKAEKVIPGMTPVDLIDNRPLMKSMSSRYD
ncbi:MAG: nitrous oxide reductase family maturation protein NosD [Bacteroidetes bacterium]|nr:nitrous oxide reductase family maturation protein NosD [Bacteroidota bacterium]